MSSNSTTVRKTETVDITRFKSDGPKGRFTALVAVFNNVDLVGDRIIPGAFKNNIQEWVLSGDPIPMIFSHDWGNINSHIGSFDPLLARETGEGLELTGHIDLDDPPAAKIWKLLKERRIREFSFAYDVVRERRASDSANELLELRIIESGPTLRGANPDTRLIDVKHAFQERQRARATIADRGGLRAELERKFDPAIVAVVYGTDPASRAAEARAAERAKALAAFERVNEDLRVAGTIPGIAADRERAANQLERDRVESAARDAEKRRQADDWERSRRERSEQILDEMPAAFGGRQGR